MPLYASLHNRTSHKAIIITLANDTPEPLICHFRRLLVQFSRGSALLSATDSRSSETLVSEQWGPAVAPRKSSNLTTCWQTIQGRDPKTPGCFVTSTSQFMKSRKKGIGDGR